jgi:hypothetical protein
LTQIPDRGVQAVSRGAARCASQVLGRGAQAVSRGAAALPQQEKNNSADLQRKKKLNITGFICSAARKPSRRCKSRKALRSKYRIKYCQPLGMDVYCLFFRNVMSNLLRISPRQSIFDEVESNALASRWR